MIEASMPIPVSPAGGDRPAYLSGFANDFESEAIAGALPRGRNSPQRPMYGLYAEQLSGTAFTAPRAENRRSWLYRLRPSAMHDRYKRAATPASLVTAPFPPSAAGPNRLRWNPMEAPSDGVQFPEGIHTIAGNGAAASDHGVAIHLYGVTASMTDRVFVNVDGELLIVPQQGTLRLFTELGVLEAAPGQIALIPRGLRFRVEVVEFARGYICENYGAPFRLPELGPLGSNGLAASRDFLAPVAAFEDVDRPTEIVQKFQGEYWSTTVAHSPLDVVAWHGNLAPSLYDLSNFNTIGTVSFDHPDPSILTVLTSPSDRPGVANCDFVIFPPRWLVAEDTFRPPWFHRNVMNEYMGLIFGEYDAKTGGGFVPGGGSLHNRMSAHGPDAATTAAAVSAELAPTKLDHTLAFMFESCAILNPTRFALEGGLLQDDYDACWAGFPKGLIE